MTPSFLNRSSSTDKVVPLLFSSYLHISDRKFLQKDFATVFSVLLLLRLCYRNFFASKISIHFLWASIRRRQLRLSVHIFCSLSALFYAENVVFEPVCQSEARTPVVPPSLCAKKKVAACGRDCVCRRFLPHRRAGAVICYSATNTWWHCGIIALEAERWTGERGSLVISHLTPFRSPQMTVNSDCPAAVQS